jgi:hypothetical protein
MKFYDLSESNQNQLLNATQYLMSTVFNVYGKEEGERVWGEISDVLGEGVRAEILMRALSGKAIPNTKMCLVKIIPGGQGKYSNQTNRVAFIKKMREVSGCGLKEAIDAGNMLDGGNEVRLEMETKNFNDYEHYLRQFGMTIEFTIDN